MSETEWTPRRKTTAMLALLCAVLALVIAGLLAQRAGVVHEPAPPIYRQNCTELTSTYQQITADLAPDKSFETRRRATEDGSLLAARVAELGGCPGEPSLQ